MKEVVIAAEATGRAGRQLAKAGADDAAAAAAPLPLEEECELIERGNARAECFEQQQQRERAGTSQLEHAERRC